MECLLNFKIAPRHVFVMQCERDGAPINAYLLTIVKQTVLHFPVHVCEQQHVLCKQVLCIPLPSSLPLSLPVEDSNCYN